MSAIPMGQRRAMQRKLRRAGFAELPGGNWRVSGKPLPLKDAYDAVQSLIAARQKPTPEGVLSQMRN